MSRLGRLVNTTPLAPSQSSKWSLYKIVPYQYLYLCKVFSSPCLKYAIFWPYFTSLDISSSAYQPQNSCLSGELSSQITFWETGNLLPLPTAGSLCPTKILIATKLNYNTSWPIKPNLHFSVTSWNLRHNYIFCSTHLCRADCCRTRVALIWMQCLTVCLLKVLV